MKYISAGFFGAVRLFVCMLVVLIIIPPTVVGLLVGLIWNAFLIGYRSDDELLNWLVGDATAWRVKISFGSKEQQP